MGKVRRRQFLLVIGSAIASPLTTLAQPKIPTVGLLWNDSVKPSPYQVTLLKALRDRGYEVGRNILIDDRISLEGYGHMADGALELVHAKVNVIVTFGATATLAAAKATKDVAIVMIAGIDPVKAGLAVSMSRPGKNVTGLTQFSAELQAKRVQLIAELVPDLRRIGLIFAPEGGAASIFRAETERAAQALKIKIHVADVRKLEDLEGAFAALSSARVQAAVVVPSSFLASHSDRVVAQAAACRIPTIYTSWRYAEVGGLLAYGVDIHGAVARAAGYIERILKGASPGDLPIEEPVKFELVINMKAAKQLGLNIPQSILIRADRVVE